MRSAPPLLLGALVVVVLVVVLLARPEAPPADDGAIAPPHRAGLPGESGRPGADGTALKPEEETTPGSEDAVAPEPPVAHPVEAEREIPGYVQMDWLDPGSRLRAQLEFEPVQETKRVKTSQSDSLTNDGRYNVRLIPGNAYKVRVAMIVLVVPGVGRREITPDQIMLDPATISVLPGAQQLPTITASLKSGEGEITARVTADPGNEPVAGALLGLERSDGGRWVPYGEIQTDANGVAVAQQLQTGEYRLALRYAGQFGQPFVAHADEVEEVEQTVHVQEGRPGDAVSFRVQRGGRLDVVVKGEDSVPTSSIRVSLARLGADEVWRPAHTQPRDDAASGFTFHGLAPGRYRVLLRPEGRTTTSAVAEVVAGRASQVTLPVGSKGVSLVLQYDGTFPSGSRSLRANLNRWDSAEAQDARNFELTPEKRRIVLQGVSAGEYAVILWDQKLALLLSARGDATFALPPLPVLQEGDLTIAVQANRNSAPANRLFVGLREQDEADSEPRWIRFAEAWPRRAVFPRVRHGAYELIVLDGAFGVWYGFGQVRRIVEVKEDASISIDV